MYLGEAHWHIVLRPGTISVLYTLNRPDATLAHGCFCLGYGIKWSFASLLNSSYSESTSIKRFANERDNCPILRSNTNGRA